MYSRSQLAQDFRTLGIAPGDTVMVHASVRAVGPVAGGPDQIHLALKDALTERGTLMMYASCPDYYDEVGRGRLSPEQEREILEKLPVFDPLTARSARECRTTLFSASAAIRYTATSTAAGNGGSGSGRNAAATDSEAALRRLSRTHDRNDPRLADATHQHRTSVDALREAVARERVAREALDAALRDAILPADATSFSSCPCGSAPEPRSK